jgi:hypothetical protein
MADTRPTPVGFLGAVRLCWLLIFTPKRFLDVQAEDTQARNAYLERIDEEPRAYIVRRAFLYSLLLVLTSGVLGYGVGVGLGLWFTCASSTYIMWLQIAGASLLLWGTLFIRGWEIQTYAGVTFTERVNQWIYRFLYFVGTATIVCSLAWSPCTK